MPESSLATTGRLFISYRREDTAYAAGWLFTRLVERFGRDRIFKDIDSIRPGDDFTAAINSAVGSCEVLVALIGRQWLTVRDEDGNRRLDNADDLVRLEVEAALERDVRVIPVLVSGAKMPRTDELPPGLGRLARRQALELTPEHFDADTGRLLTVLEASVGETPAETPRRGGEPSQTRRPASLRALLVEARAERRLGHYQTAIDLLDDLLAIEPANDEAQQLRAETSQQLFLATAYDQATASEQAGHWRDASRAYAEILVLDPRYRDVAARRRASQQRHQVTDLQAELRHHAAAQRWDAVLAVDAELMSIDPAAADPDGLASSARAHLTHQRGGERAATDPQTETSRSQRQITSPPDHRSGQAVDHPPLHSDRARAVSGEKTRAAARHRSPKAVRQSVTKRAPAFTRDRLTSSAALWSVFAGLLLAAVLLAFVGPAQSFGYSPASAQLSVNGRALSPTNPSARVDFGNPISIKANAARAPVSAVHTSVFFLDMTRPRDPAHPDKFSFSSRAVVLAGPVHATATNDSGRSVHFVLVPTRAWYATIPGGALIAAPFFVGAYTAATLGNVRRRRRVGPSHLIGMALLGAIVGIALDDASWAVGKNLMHSYVAVAVVLLTIVAFTLLLYLVANQPTAARRS